jgi:regulator of ribonuclease activity A
MAGRGAAAGGADVADFRTTDLCDEHGAAVQVAEPLFQSFGGRRRFAGPAATIRCLDDNSRVREAVAEPGAGRILVVDGAGSRRCALLGDLLGAKAVANGWSGVIVNGCVRDTAALAGMDLGVLALAALPRRSDKRGLGEREVPVSFAGVAVRPGDYLYADEDGLIVSTGGPLA